MARGLNRVQLIGHVGRDPEMRYTAGGQAVTNFTVAVNRTRRSPDGTASDDTEWFRVVAWEKLAEIADQYLRKGGQVYVVMWTEVKPRPLGGEVALRRCFYSAWFCL